MEQIVNNDPMKQNSWTDWLLFNWQNDTTKMCLINRTWNNTPFGCQATTSVNSHSWSICITFEQYSGHPENGKPKSKHFQNVYVIFQRKLNTLRPRQNGHHFAEDTFNRIFVNENVTILIEFSLKFAPKGPINNIPALVQIMAWRRPGDKPLSEPMLGMITDAYMRHSASMS